MWLNPPVLPIFILTFKTKQGNQSMFDILSTDLACSSIQSLLWHFLLLTHEICRHKLVVWRLYALKMLEGDAHTPKTTASVHYPWCTRQMSHLWHAITSQKHPRAYKRVGWHAFTPSTHLCNKSTRGVYHANLKPPVFCHIRFDMQREHMHNIRGIQSSHLFVTYLCFPVKSAISGHNK
jgi:hypothetical protein